MPRKPLIYTDEFPYHVTARSNNKEWFYIPIEDLWNIFSEKLNQIQSDFNCALHAFVLMNNHYHALLSTSKEWHLGDVMQYLQRSVSRTVNLEVGRVNHVFGGPYKGCLIDTPAYYHHALKYVYRNPVEAGLSSQVEDYRYSTLNQSSQLHLPQINIEKPITGIDELVPETRYELLNWCNTAHREEAHQLIQKAMSKTQFKIPGRKKHLL